MVPEERVVYVVGLEPHTARAIYADLAGVAIRRLRPLHGGSAHSRRGRRPTLLILGLDLPDLMCELEAAQAAWGESLVAVGIGRYQPLACVWRGPGPAELVEIGPGFLAPFLEPASPVAGDSADHTDPQGCGEAVLPEIELQA